MVKFISIGHSDCGLYYFAKKIIFMDFELTNSLSLFINYFIRAPIGYILLSLLLKETKWSSRNILFSWLAFTLLIVINYVFYSLEEFVMYKILFLTSGAVCTFIIRFYYLRHS